MAALGGQISRGGWARVRERRETSTGVGVGVGAAKCD
jgi:hypothetical protein